MRVPPPPALAVVLVALLAGCGHGGSGGSDAGTQLLTGATATAGSHRIAPPGAPYSYRIPRGWHSLAHFAIGDPSPRTRDRSVIVRGSGLIYVAAADRGTASVHTLAAQYERSLKQLGMSIQAGSAALVGKNPAVIFDVEDVPLPGGATARARKVLIFGSDSIVIMNCQWSSTTDQQATLTACDRVRATMHVT
jgi:hypothetical protein